MQSLADKLRRAQKQCKKYQGIEKQAQQCFKQQVCQKAKQKCAPQQQKLCQKQGVCEPACKRKVQCAQPFKSGKPINVSQKQVQLGCKLVINDYNQSLTKKKQCDRTQITRRHQQQTRRTPSGGIGRI